DLAAGHEADRPALDAERELARPPALVGEEPRLVVTDLDVDRHVRVVQIDLRTRVQRSTELDHDVPRCDRPPAALLRTDRVRAAVDPVVEERLAHTHDRL